MSSQELLTKINEKIDHLTVEVNTIKRGVYGDENNNVKGLLQRQDVDELERLNMKEAIQGVKNNIWKISVGAGLFGSFIIWVLKLLV